MLQYKCKWFKLQELVDPVTYKARGDKAWELIDNRVLITLDALREKYGAISVNTWHTGGDRKWSGLRTIDSPWFSTYSQHSFGRAADCIFHDCTAESVRQDIINNENAFIKEDAFDYITSIELDVSWLHFDTRNCNTLKAFKP